MPKRDSQGRYYADVFWEKPKAGQRGKLLVEYRDKQTADQRWRRAWNGLRSKLDK